MHDVNGEVKRQHREADRHQINAEGLREQARKLLRQAEAQDAEAARMRMA